MSQNQRLLWVDVAKGIAIILVALVHAVGYLTLTGLAHGVWEPANKLFQTFRMPLFFLMAGLLARSAINRTWSDLWRSRLALLVWTYVLWNVILFLYYAILPSVINPSRADPLRLLLAFVWPSSIWFLHALVVFLVGAKLLAGRISPRVQVASAALISTVAIAFPVIPNSSYSGVLSYGVFFLGGCYGRELIAAYASRTQGWKVMLFGVLFVAASFGVAVSGAHRIALFPLSILAVAWGVILSAWLARLRAFSWLGFLGRQTLGVYLMHAAVISATTRVLLILQAAAWPGFLWISPLLVTGISVGVAVGIRSLARGTVLDYAFTAPKFLMTMRRKGIRQEYLQE